MKSARSITHRFHRLTMPLVLGAASAAVASTALAQSVSQVPGKLTVSDVGAASYSIPLSVPPGIQGIEPKLALTYNHQAGNGVAGVGWGLSGLSSIARCQKNRAVHGEYRPVQNDAQDRYCLDGKNLMLVNLSQGYGSPGSEYRTERDEGLRVIANGGTAATGPASFTVTRRDGVQLEFGGTTDSRIEAGQGSTVIRAWALNKVTDTKNNYMAVFYSEDNANGAYYPVSIWYTGNIATGYPAKSSINFTYEARPDVVPQYQAGRYAKYTLRLKLIEAATNSSSIRGNSWTLEYSPSPSTQRSRLLAVQQCAGGPGSQCLPKLAIGWDTGDAVTTSSLNNASLSVGIAQSAVMPVELNNDGYLDWMGIEQPYWDPEVPSPPARTLVLSASKFTAPNSYVTTTTSLPAPASGTLFTSQKLSAVPFQMGRDDKIDVLVQEALTLTRSSPSPTSQGVSAFKGLGNGQFQTTPVTLPPESYGSTVMDYDGDGLSDLVRMVRDEDPCAGYRPTDVKTSVFRPAVWQQSEASTFSRINPAAPAISITHSCSASTTLELPCEAINLNGDGRPDLMCSAGAYMNPPSVSFLANTPTGYTQSNGPAISYPVGKMYPADINGDGLDDVVKVATGAADEFGSVHDDYRAFVNTGAGFYDATGYSRGTFTGWKVAAIADVDGDGLTDVILKDKDGLYVARFNGSALVVSTWLSGVNLNDWVTTGGSFNGSAFSGLVARNTATIQHYPVKLNTFDRVVEFYDGIRNDRIAYATLPNLHARSITDSTASGGRTRTVASAGGSATNTLLRQVQELSYDPVTIKPGLTVARVPVLPAIPVVDTITQRNGFGVDRVQTYSYGTAITELGGRGTLGLNWVEKYDGASQATERQTFAFSAPTDGLPQSIVWTKGGATRLRTISYGCRDQRLSTTTACKSNLDTESISLVFPSSIKDVVKDTPTNVVGHTSLTQALADTDAYGNALKVTISKLKPDGAASGFYQEVSTTYKIDTAKWIVDRKLSQKVRAVSP